jgi:Putative beta barrel porin-7 (BBP7)
MKRLLFALLAVCSGMTLEAQAGDQPAPNPTVIYDPAAPVGNACDSPPTCTLDSCCNPGYRFWGSAEYLLWWMKGASVPPLATTSPAGTPQSMAGVAGPGTTVLYGNSNVNDTVRPGGRVDFGFWNECGTCGLEINFFMLGSNASEFGAASTGSPILARPFFDAVAGKPSSELVALPGLVSGSVTAAESSSGLIGADALFRCPVCCGCCYRLDAVAGFRYLRISDTLGIEENLVSTDATGASVVPLGTTIMVTDRFETSNDFYALDLGLRGQVQRGPWVLRGNLDLAIGDNHEILEIAGSTTVTVPGVPPPVVRSGGLLALSSNIGHYTRDRVEVVPEVGVQLGYQVTSRIQVYAGYTFMYWGEVARPGGAIDPVINPNLLPPPVSPLTGPLRPEPKFDNTSLWIQGIDFGIEFRF